MNNMPKNTYNIFVESRYLLETMTENNDEPQTLYVSLKETTHDDKNEDVSLSFKIIIEAQDISVSEFKEQIVASIKEKIKELATEVELSPKEQFKLNLSDSCP